MARTIAPNLTKTTSRAERISSVESRIISAKQALGPLKACFYGRNGAGKTHLAGSTDLKTLILDCNEEGFESVSDRDNVKIIRVGGWLETDDIYWYLKGGNHPWEIIVIDTISSLANLGMKWVLGDTAERNGSVDPKMPSQPTYGKLGIIMTDFIYDWRNLPYNIIFLAQERKFTTQGDEESEENVTVEIGPSITPKPLSALMTSVGTVGRLYTREVTVKDRATQKTVQKIERRMLVGPHERFMSKTRIKGLPRVVRKPTLAEILKIRAQSGELKENELVGGENALNV